MISPVAIPFSMFSLVVNLSGTIFCPLQTGQVFLKVLPLPPHLLQVFYTYIFIFPILIFSTTEPLPPHLGHDFS